MIFRPDETKQTDNLRVFMAVTISQHGWRLFRFRNSFHKVIRGLARAGLDSHQVSSSFSLVMQLFCRSMCYLLNKIPWDHSSATRWTPELLCLHNDNNSLEAREPCCRAEVLSSSPLRQLLVGMVSVRQALHTPHLSLPKPKELSPLKSSISSYLPSLPLCLADTARSTGTWNAAPDKIWACELKIE